MTTLMEAKKSFDGLYGSLSLPTILFDETARIISANQSFLDLVKAGRDDLQTSSMVSFFKDIKTTFETGTFLRVIPNNVITRISDVNGTSIPVRLYYTKLAKGDELAMGGIGFITDLKNLDSAKEKVRNLTLENEEFKKLLSGKTPKKSLKEKVKIEKELNDTKVFLENLLDSCGDGIYTLGNDNRISLVNKSFADMLGKEKDELIGIFPYELGPWQGNFQSTTGETIVFDQSYYDYQTSHLDKRHKIRTEDGGKIENWEFYAQKKNGKIVPLDMTLSIRKNKEGDFTGSVATVRDLTKRRVAENKKKKAEKALQEAYRFRSQFYTNITHAFRTPLTLAIGPIEGILRGEFGEVNSRIKEQLSVAMRNSRQLLKLINQLLDFSKLESGKHKVLAVKKDMEQFISTILDSFSFIAKKKKIKLLFKSSRNIPLVSIDPVKMEKVLFNLIGNAFKFTPENGRITITIAQGSEPGGKAEENEIVITNKGSCITTTAVKNNYLKISIIDTGIGIKKDDLASIFDRFEQGSKEHYKEHAGTGIGLAHARELVELMNGCITVKSEQERGSRFSIYLPIERKGLVDTPAADRPENGLLLQPEVELSDIHHGKDVLTDSISGRKPLILILDDNPDIRQYVSGVLKQKYDFILARNGVEGLKKLQQHTPDLLLCDIMMPDMDGHEFLKRVKKNPALKNIPFIFLTARADIKMKIEGLEKGADDYIVKPFNSLELLARVKSLLRIRNLLGKTAAQEKTIGSLTRQLQGKYGYGNIVGNSPPMRKIYQLLETIKDSDSNVLVTGETGTGKELIANAIHYNSPRKNGPFISVNCGAIPKELMEREFFGHVKGAFTGAVESRKGYFTEADGGTLFLDEIGEMDKDMQVKLLRVLEQGEIVRIGDSVSIKTNIHLVTATNKDLKYEIQNGNFREDLYYRLHVIPVHIPPLRQRSNDIPLLIEHFRKNLQEKFGRQLALPSEQEMWSFMNYLYPGNVRELENIVERFYLLGANAGNLFVNQAGNNRGSSGNVLYKELLASTNPLKTVASTARAKAERNLIMHVLQTCDNNYKETARVLNIGLSSLYRKLKNT